MKLDKSINTVIKKINKLNGESPDFTTRIISFKNSNIAYCFYESVSSDDKISDFLVKSLTSINKDNIYKDLLYTLSNSIYNSSIKEIDSYEECSYYLSSGFTIIIIDNSNKALAIETRETLDRGIEKSESEATIKGPKDSFTENYNKNIGLIRKRIKDDNLRFKEFKVGIRTQNKMSIVYEKDIVNTELLKNIINKIKDINIDGVLDIGYIRDFLVEDNETVFPVVITTERPDLVCGNLLEGKIAIILENSPNVIVLPATLDNFLHSPEDSYQKAINVTFTRLIRLIAMIATITTPAFYIALTTFNQEVIPDTLLISLAIQKAGTPFPTFIAVIVLMITFELLRESDMRLPTKMGTSISIVGALVLGDAAVSAGLVSPIIVIIVALTSITGLLFTDLDIINAFRWWRLLFIILSSFIGLIGFVLACIIFINKLCSIDSFNVPYLIPYSPFNKSIIDEGIITKPHNKLIFRPDYLTNNKRRLNK